MHLLVICIIITAILRHLIVVELHNLVTLWHGILKNCIIPSDSALDAKSERTTGFAALRIHKLCFTGNATHALNQSDWIQNPPGF